MVKAVCSKFGATTCEAHQALETPARVELCGTNVADAATRALLPDKTIVERIVDVAPVSGYQELIAKAARSSARGFTAAELKQVRDQLREAEAKIEKEDWARRAQDREGGADRAREGDAVREAGRRDHREDRRRTRRSRSRSRSAAEKQGDVVGALRILETAVEQSSPRPIGRRA